MNNQSNNSPFGKINLKKPEPKNNLNSAEPSVKPVSLQKPDKKIVSENDSSKFAKTEDISNNSVSPENNTQELLPDYTSKLLRNFSDENKKNTELISNTDKNKADISESKISPQHDVKSIKNNSKENEQTYEFQHGSSDSGLSRQLILIIIILLFVVGIMSGFLLATKNKQAEDSTIDMPDIINTTPTQPVTPVTDALITDLSVEISDNSTEEPKSFETEPPKTESVPEIIVETDNIGVPPKFPYISATSELSPIVNNDGTFYYSASKANDGNYSTCWAEGVSGDGTDESIFMYADKKQRVSEIIITNGLYTNSELFYKNNRVKDCRIEFSDGTSHEITLLGEYSEQSNSIVFNPPVDTEYIKFTILSVYYGNKYNDTCITEISVN